MAICLPIEPQGRSLRYEKNMLGFLNINKPAGWTSRDVVNRVQRLVRPAKTGHAGTLDPLATGVLVVGVGRATRLIEYVQQKPKRYQAKFLLGCTSESDDTETNVRELVGATIPTRAEIETALPHLVGRIEQRPPDYSAVHIAGRRAYRLAREGKSISLPPRIVEVHSLAILGYEYPELELDILCGSGTYVRSLGRDLAESLGTGAVLSDLIRTEIGEFELEDSLSVDELTSEAIPKNLLPPVAAVSHLPQLVLSEDQVGEIRFGRPIPFDMPETQGDLAGIDSDGQLVAVLRQKRAGVLAPHRNFAPLI